MSLDASAVYITSLIGDSYFKKSGTKGTQRRVYFLCPVCTGKMIHSFGGRKTEERKLT